MTPDLGNRDRFDIKTRTLTRKVSRRRRRESSRRLRFEQLTQRWLLSGSEGGGLDAAFDAASGGARGEPATSSTNSPPVLDANNVLMLPASGGAVITSSHLHTTDVDNPPAELAYSLTALPTKGTLRLDGTAAGWLHNPANGHYYRSSTPSTWHGANAEATALGGYLAAVRDAAENDWIVNHFAGVGQAWLGLTDDGNEGNFSWTSGELRSYTNWYPGEPNGGADENFVQIYLAGNGTGQWNDLRADARILSGIIERNSSSGLELGFTQEDVNNGRVSYQHYPLDATSGDRFTFTVSDGAGGVISPTVFQIAVTTDNTGPAIMMHSPSGQVTGPRSAIRFDFDQPIDPLSFSVAEDVTGFAGPSGSLLDQVTGFTYVDNDTLEVAFNEQTAAGLYAMTLGPQILDLAGNAMDQDGDGVAGETPDDRYPGCFTITADYALHFDGGDRVTIPNSAALNPSKITVETWVNFGRLASGGGTSGTDEQFLVNKGGDRTSGAYRLMQWGRPGEYGLSFCIGHFANAWGIASAASLEVGRWYHVAGTYDGQTMRIYLDGILLGSLDVGSIAVGNGSPLYLSYNDVSGFPFRLTGQLDEVRIWNRALTAEEIQATMRGPLTGTESGLAAYWDFNEPVDSQAVLDRTANDANGYLGASTSVGSDDPTRIPRGLPPMLTSWSLDEDTGADPNDALTNDTTPTFTFQFSEAVFGQESDIEILDPSSTPVAPDTISGFGTDRLTVSRTTPLSAGGEYTLTLKGTGTLKDADGNPFNGGADQMLHFTLDVTAPAVTAVTVSDSLLADADVGAARFGVTVEFSEAMDPIAVPSLAFLPAVTTSLTLNTAQSGWTDADSYVAVYDVADAGVSLANIDIGVSGVQDAAGNSLAEHSAADQFAIDTQNPPAPVVSRPASAVWVNADTYVIEGTAEAGSLVTVYVDANNNNQVDAGEEVAGQQQLNGPGFDGDGKVTTKIGWGGTGQSMAVEAGGKILLAGYSYNGSNDDFTLVRYNYDGSLDTTLDGDGKLTTAIGPRDDRAYGVAVQADGKILLGGESWNGSNYDFALVRYNVDGSLDTTFGVAGIVTTAIGNADDHAYSVALQTDGKILLGGYAFSGSSHDDFALVRYNTDGSLDTSFGGDGVVTTGIGASSDHGRSVAVQADGKILLGGYSSIGSSDDFAVARYNTDGSLDTSFDGDGKVTTNIISTDRAESVAVQADGKILLGGFSFGAFALVRYNTDGSLDMSFDGDGRLTTDFEAPVDHAYSVALQPDGKILLGGTSYVGGWTDFTLVRYVTDGSLDYTFDGDGKVTTAISVGNDAAYSVAVQPDGKILLGGESVNGTFALARYNGDGSLDDASTFSIRVSLTPDAGNNFIVTASDTAGNVSPATDVPAITEDSQAPAAPVVANPTSPVTANAATYLIEGTAEADSLVTVYVDGNNNSRIDSGEAVAGRQQLSGGASVFSVSVRLVRGAANNFVVTATDAAANVSATADVPTIVEDSQAPPAPAVTDPAAPVAVNEAAYLIKGTAQADSLVKVCVDADNNNQADAGEVVAGQQQLAGGSSDFSITVTLTQDAANHFVVTAADAAGNVSAAADVPMIAQDSQTPAAPAVTDPVSAVTVNAAAYRIEGTAEAASLVTVYVDANNNNQVDAGEAVAGQQQLTGTGFDGDGIVTTAIGASYDYGNSVAVQADGKILLAGEFHNGSNYDFALVRYNADGSLDTSFGIDGRVTSAIGAASDYGRSVAVQADGKILLAGDSDNGTNRDFALARYNVDGTLDITFDGDGKLTTAIGSSNDYGYSVAVQADGKILLGGYSHNGSNWDFALARYNADGTLDADFDGDGKLTTAIGAGNDRGQSLALQADGKILLGGASWNGSDWDFALVRYNADGSLDGTFDDDGKLTTGITGSTEYVGSVAVQADGKILLGGSSGGDFALVRYNADGSLDASFDGDGKVTTAIGAANDAGNSVAVQADGKIVVGGHSWTGSKFDFAVVRYNSDGSLDASFDGDGKVTTMIGDSEDLGQSVAVQADGKVLLGGYSHDAGDPDFALVRYNADGTLDDGTRFSIRVPLMQNAANNFVVTATDAAGNVSAAADVPTITEDSLGPAVTAVAVNDLVLADADVGEARFVVTVDFSETMDCGAFPNLLFDPDVASTLIWNAEQSGWSDGDTYVAKFDVADADAELEDITIDVTGGKDATGNEQRDYTPENEFDIDTQNPTVDIVDVAPDPRNTAVDTVSLSFSEAVDGFSLVHLTLSRDGGDNLLTTAQTLTTIDKVTWTLGNLAGLTAAQGSYTMTLTAPHQEIRDAAGNPLAQDASDGWTMIAGTAVHVELVPVATPSPLEATGLPTAISQAVVNSSYYVELWVQDRSANAVGVQGGSVDVHYSDTVLVGATRIFHDDFAVLPSGQIRDDQALIDDLGGATLDTSRGVMPQWARMAYVEVQATGVGSVSYSLTEGRFRFALSGLGNLDWNQVDLTDTAEIQHVPGAQVDVRLVRTPTSTDADGEADVIPGNAAWLHEWEPHWAEIWLSTPNTDSLGILGANVSVSYTTELASAKQVDFHPSFTAQGMPTIDDMAGQIIAIRGTTTAVDLGDDRPVLLARILFEPTSADQTAVNVSNTRIGPYPLAVRLQDGEVDLTGGVGTVPAQLGAAASAEMWAVMYDVDDSDLIDFGDFSLFAPRFGQTVSAADPYTWWADFDKSGAIDFGDFSFFAPNFGTSKPDAQLRFPDTYPEAWRAVGAQRAMSQRQPSAEFAADSSGVAEGESGGSVINLKLVALRQPSVADTTDSLPAPIAGFAADSSVYLEIWAQQTQGTAGLSGGSVDVRLSPDAHAAVQELRHGAVYSVLATGSLADPALVDNFGGATFAGGLAVAPQWVRLGWIEARLATAGEIRFELEPGQFQFSLFGFGNVSWDQIDLDAVTVNEPTWHKAVNAPDVNDDGTVTPLDVLVVINEINLRPVAALLPAPPAVPHPYYDVNNDGVCTPIDVLMVINYLNRNAANPGEGEAAAEHELAGTWNTRLPALPLADAMTERPSHAVWDARSPAIDHRVKQAYDPMAERSAVMNEGSKRYDVADRVVVKSARLAVDAVLDQFEPLVPGVEAVLQEIASDVNHAGTGRIDL